MDEDFVTHTRPVWGEHADSFVFALIIDGDREQLWAKKCEDGTYMVCCIPFFVDDVCLGDFVKTDSANTMTEVLRWSGRFVFRVHFCLEDQEMRAAVHNELWDHGGLIEHATIDTIAIDIADLESANQVAELLKDRFSKGEIYWETGHTKDYVVRNSDD